jgi:hypothetical protein
VRELGGVDPGGTPPAQLAVRADQRRELVAEERPRSLGVAVELDPVARSSGRKR